MKTADFVKQNIAAVLEFYQLPPITGGKHYQGECPMCSSKGSYRMDNKFGNGEWICKCGQGNIWKLLAEVTKKPFQELANEIDKEFDNKADYQQSDKQFTRNKPLETAMARWKRGQRIHNTNIQGYLNGRGIYSMPNRAMCWSNGNMYCLATDTTGMPFYSHETYLEGDKKADVLVNKKLISLQPNAEYGQNIAIRLFEVAETLGIAEGIETALSAHQIYKCPVWSTVNSGYMDKFKAPDGVKHLIIFADNDNNGTGLAAAFTCGKKNIVANNDVEKVTIKWCGDCCDFNDMLINGSEVFEWVLTK